MRKSVTVLLATVALGASAANSTGLAYASAKAAPKKKVTTRKLSGQSATADRWGTVTVNVTLRTVMVGGKKTRKYVDLGGSYTYHTDRSQFIMSQSLPLLRQEFLQAQSPNVQMISGATYTSQAFVQSLQSALAKA
jgi:uncharacterized protein with FMN-binding domain